jgi:hypothetical protein
MKTSFLMVSGIALAMGVGASAPVQAKTMKECAAQWKEMKAANQTGGMKYRDFTKQCMSGGAAPAAEAPSGTETKETAKPAAQPAPEPSGNIVFPSAISSKYSKQSAGKARMLTCRDQYEANKATSANGGLKWIQKGGGYYSLCNKHLKGQA